MTRAQKACTHTCLREVGPGVPASSAGLQPGSLHSPLESFQHAETQCEAAPNLDSQRLSPIAGHSHGWRLLPITAAASAFLHPFAPWALPHISAHMGALTPVRLTRSQPLAGQVSLVHMTRTSMHSVTIHLTRPIIASALPAQRDRLPGIRSDGFALSAAGSGLHLESAGSSLRTAESCSSSYGLHVCLGLLPTPPRGDAVTFDYRERASPGGGLAPPCSRLLPGARIPAFAGMTSRGVIMEVPRHNSTTLRAPPSPRRARRHREPRGQGEHLVRECGRCRVIFGCGRGKVFTCRNGRTPHDEPPQAMMIGG